MRFLKFDRANTTCPVLFRDTKTTQSENSSITRFDLSCFNGEYVTGDVNQEYLDHIEDMRRDSAKSQWEANEENLIDISNNA